MGSIIASALVAGSLYALMASGLSLVWGALGVFNFAHGVLLMLGAYAAWLVASPSGLDAGLGAGIVASIAFMVVMGVVLYVLLVRPWVGKPDAGMAVIMTTIAGAMFVENLILWVFGGRFKSIPHVVPGVISVGGTVIQGQELLAILLAPALLGGFAVLLRYSRIGLSIRAVAENRDAAMLLGVSVERTYIAIFVLSSVLAGVAGIMLGGLFNISPVMGDDPLLRAFVVVVFGDSAA